MSASEQQERCLMCRGEGHWRLWREHVCRCPAGQKPYVARYVRAFNQKVEEKGQRIRMALEEWR